MAAVPAVLRPSAAGVDIGAREIFVAVPADRDPQPVRSTMPPSLKICTGWRTGWSNAVSRPLPWNPLASTGFRCFRFWKHT